VRILIIRFSSLGDITMATALPRVLRKKFPEAKIDFAVAEEFKDIIEWNPYLNEKIYLSRSKGLTELIRVTKEIRKRNYDIIIDAHRSIRSRFICLFTPFIKKIYFNKRLIKRSLLIFFKINFFRKVDPQMVEYIKPLKKIGVEYDGLGTEIIVPDNIRDNVKKVLSSRIKDFGKRKFIGFVPSAHWPGKRWSADHFQDLVGLILKELDVDVVVVGGKKDHFCGDIVKSYDRAYSFAGEFGIAGSAAVLSMCDLVIANDTGMMHVAEAVGVDVIGIMGPTSYEFGCYPYRSGSRVVELNMWCRPCSKNGKGCCVRHGRRPCLNDITPDMVLDEVLDYWRHNQ